MVNIHKQQTLRHNIVKSRERSISFSNLQMKLNLANQRMLLVVCLLAWKPFVVSCVYLTAGFKHRAVEPLIAMSVCAKLNLTGTGMDLQTIKTIE
jgi:hypothetical protein